MASFGSLPKRHGMIVSMQDAQHPVGEIVEIVAALAPEAIGIFHQLRARILLHALDRGFRRQPCRDGLAHAPCPAAVVGEHLHGLDDFLVLVAGRLVVDEEAVDILPEAQQRFVQALELRGDVVGEKLENLGTGLVQRDMAERKPVVQRRPFQGNGGFPPVGFRRDRPRKAARRDHLRQHHRGRLEGLDLLVGVAALDLVLDRRAPRSSGGRAPSARRETNGKSLRQSPACTRSAGAFAHRTD